MVEEARVRIVLEGSEGERVTAEKAEDKEKRETAEKESLAEVLSDRRSLRDALAAAIREQGGGEFVAEIIESGLVAGGAGLLRKAGGLSLIRTPFGVVLGVGAAGVATGVAAAESARALEPIVQGIIGELFPEDNIVSRLFKQSVQDRVSELFGGKDIEAARASVGGILGAISDGKQILDALTQTGITLTEKEASTLLDNLRSFNEVQQRIELAEASAQRTQTARGASRQFRNLLFEMIQKSVRK